MAETEGVLIEEIERRLRVQGLFERLRHWDVEPDPECGSITLNRMNVKKDYRKRGLAHLILDVFTGFCDEHQLNALLTAKPIPEEDELDNAAPTVGDLVRLYSKHGWVRTGVRDDMYRQWRPREA